MLFRSTRLSEQPLKGVVGIGHTRWATHGKPTENNAHPHASDRLAVVHNGIIENFQELKAELSAKGYAFQTETDTETVLHLVTMYLDAGHAPREAAHKALQRLHGAFALGLIFASLAIPLAFDAQWTAASWALEGVGLYWVAVRQHRGWVRAFALLLQAGGGISLLNEIGRAHV